MIASTAWHIVKDGEQIPFVKSFRMVTDIGHPFTTVMIETFVVDKHGIPEAKFTNKTEYWVRNVWFKDGNPYLEVADIPDNYDELVP